MSPGRLIKTAASYPLTWVAVIALGAMEVGFVRWFAPDVSMLLASGVLSMALLLLWPIALLRTRAFLEAMYQLPSRVSQSAMVKIDALAADLQQVASDKGLEQLRLLQQKLEVLTEVLKRRMSEGELTFGRYLGTGEQVYLSAIDNLHEIAVALTSVSSIDGEYLDERIAEVRTKQGAQDGNEHDARREIENLEQRRSLLEQQHRKVSELFAQNEAAMTALDNTATALADARIGKGHASMEAEVAMAELDRLAKRADSYASHSSRR